MALTAPKCGTNFSQVRNQDIIILLTKAKYDADGNLIPPTLKDFYLPTAFSKLSDSPNAKLDTQTVANSKETRSDLINYDSELKATIVHDQLGSFGKVIADFIKAKPVNNAANWVVWEIHGLTNASIEQTEQQYLTGDGFEVLQWHGPLHFNHSWAIGDDGKMIEREFTIKNKSCSKEIEIKDESINHLVAAWIKGVNWLGAGLWNNETPEKVQVPAAADSTN